MAKLITVKELSEQIAIPKSTLYKWTAESKIPHVKMPGDQVRFDPVKIDQWIKERSINVTIYPHR
jgi:excisionase family DNA binding protein